MSDSTNWAHEPSYEVDPETYKRDYPSDEWDYSARGAWADVVATFAGVFLILSGCLEVLQGASAIDNGDLYSQGHPYLYRFDMTVWGWIHVVIGVVSVIAAIGILRRTSWGQIGGIVVTALSMIANFMFIPHYPIWSLIVIGLNVLVMWALLAQLGHARSQPGHAK